MAIIANLVVKLSANTVSFQKGMKRGERGLSEFNAKAKMTGRAFIKVGAGIAAAASLAAVAIFRFTASQITALDVTVKFAKRVGIATAELQKLQFAAELSGVGASTLNMALQRMTRRIAEAAAGTGEAKDAINELGLDARQLAEAGPERAFSMIADAMQKVEGQSDKVRLAFKLFDSEGVALINTLALGSEGLREAGDEAERLGITLSKVDSKKIEDAADAITKMGKAWAAVKQNIAIGIITAVSAVGSGFKKVAKEVELVVQLVTPLSDEINKAATAMDRMAKSASRSAESIAFAAAKAKEFADFDKQKREQRETLIDEGDALFEALRTPAEKLTVEMRHIRSLLRGSFIGIETATRARAKIQKTFEDATKGPEAKVRLALPAIPSNVTALRGTTAALSAIAESRGRTDPVARALREQIRQAQEAQRTLEDIERNTAEDNLAPAVL